MTYPATYGTLYPGLPQPSPEGPAVLARLSWLGIARERAPGIAALPAAAVPVDAGGYEPEDTIGWLLDTGLRSSMGGVAGVIPGTLTSAHSYSGPFYPDSGGFWLDNLLGDLSTVSTGTLGTAQPLTGPVEAGDTQLTVGPSLGAVTTGSVIQIRDGAASEVVVATAGSSGTTVKFAGTPARFPHAAAATAALETASAGYTHTFSVLNSGSGQPPTHTLTDTTGLTAGTGARCYPGAVVTGIDLAGDPGQGWVTAKVTGMAWSSQPSAATVPYPTTAYVAPFGGWQSTVTAGGAYAGPWAVSLKRAAVIYRGAQNAQNPWVIARGGLTVTGALGYPGPGDETPLAQMTSGALLPVQITVSTAGGYQAVYGPVYPPAPLSLTITASAVQFTQAKPDRSRIALGYATAWQAADNAADAGGSGGLSPVQAALGNFVPAY